MRPSVRIGLVAPFEGRYRYVGYDVIYAARLAIREVNSSGGVGGYSVELVAYDDGGVCDEAARCVAKLAIDDEVVGMVGHFVDGIGGGVGCDSANGGLPLVAVSGYGDQLASGSARVYRLAPPARVVADAILAHLQSQGATAPGLLADDSPIAAAIRTAAEHRGINLALDVSPSSPDYAQVVLDRAPDAVIIDAVPTASGEIAAALRGNGWRGLIVGGHNLTPTDFAAVAGPAARASCVSPWPLPHELAGGAEFAARYETVSDGVPPGRLALPAYEAIWTIIEAIASDIAQHGSPSRGGVAQALAGTRRKGLLGTITFGAERAWEDAPIYLCEVFPPPPADASSLR